MMTTKTRCDLLIRNAYVLTMDAKGTAYPDGAIAVDGRNIVAVGKEAEIRSFIPGSSICTTTRPSTWSAR